ncbi:hypothetical protein [Amycolatopsis sp. NBRC 101858]|uniref:hypothetical protein n=1 Tax=Amycolatopsis sp. NBRC 101858 TaxID=3032200 RepID=UPI0025566BC9|nr:hypothetical protein [Amycolatopsis sp. NBRC 101858]
MSDAESLRESDTELDDTAVTALAGQVDRVLEPARGLVETLTTLRHQLEATTAAALAERDAALAEADDHRRQRGLAEAEAAQAREASEDAAQVATAAEKEAAAARRERDESSAARRAALQEQQRAEGQLAAVRDELGRVAERADASAALAGERAAVIATLTTELAAARVALDEECGRSQAASARADAAEARSETTTQRLDAAETRAAAAETRAEAAAGRLDTAREELTKAATAHRSALDQARADGDRRLADVQAAHEQTVRSMHETTTNLGAELRACTGRADNAERALTRALAVLREAEVSLPEDVAAMLK